GDAAFPATHPRLGGKVAGAQYPDRAFVHAGAIMADDFYPYRPCVGICLFNETGKVFVGERIDTPGAWQMPQGGIDDGEDLLPAGLRELAEEIGSDKAELLGIMPDKVRYVTPDELRERLQAIWGKPYIGQEQTWLAMRF